MWRPERPRVRAAVAVWWVAVAVGERAGDSEGAMRTTL